MYRVTPTVFSWGSQEEEEEGEEEQQQKQKQLEQQQYKTHWLSTVSKVGLNMIHPQNMTAINKLFLLCSAVHWVMEMSHFHLNLINFLPTGFLLLSYSAGYVSWCQC